MCRNKKTSQPRPSKRETVSVTSVQYLQKGYLDPVSGIKTHSQNRTKEENDGMAAITKQIQYPGNEMPVYKMDCIDISRKLRQNTHQNT